MVDLASWWRRPAGVVLSLVVLACGVPRAVAAPGPEPAIVGITAVRGADGATGPTAAMVGPTASGTAAATASAAWGTSTAWGTSAASGTAATTASAASRSTEPFRPGRLVAGIAGLADPVAAVVDGEGRLLVLERTAARIAVHAPPAIPDPPPPAPTAEELLGPGRTDVLPPGPRRIATLGTDRLERPEAMVLAPDGAILVADSAARAVVVLDPGGGERTRLGTGVLRRPVGLAMGADGRRVVVADTVLRAIVALPLDGGPAERLAPGLELRRPVAITALPDGRLAVADAGRARIHVLDAAGDVGASFGDYGPFPGLFEEPHGLAWDGARLVVADRGNHRLQMHAADGTLLGTWGVHARRPREAGGVIHDPAALAFDPAGRYLALVEPFEDRVQLFARDPAPADAARPRMPMIPRDPHFGRRVAADGPLIVLAEPEAHRVHLFDGRRTTPILVGDFGERGEGFGLLLRPEGLALDAEAGLIHVGDAAKLRLQRFRVAWDPDEPTGFVPGRFRFARSVDLVAAAAAADGVEAGAATAPDGDRDGRGQDGDGPDGDGWDGDAEEARSAAVAIEPADLLAEPGGGVLVADAAGDRLVRFDASLGVIAAFGGRGTEPGRLRRPTAIDASPDGERLYVVDADNHRVQVLDAATGAPIAAWGRRANPDATTRAGGRGRGEDGRGGEGREDGQGDPAAADAAAADGPAGGGPADDPRFLDPFGLAVAPDGTVWVSDRGRHVVEAFSPDGRRLRWLGGKGAEHGELWKPGDLAVRPDGRVLVVDHGNHRAKLFEPDGRWWATFGTGRAFTRDTERARERARERTGRGRTGRGRTGGG